MPLLSVPVPSLVGGVSQQSAAVRLASHVEAQENAYSSIVEGLGKRSPTRHTARLGTADASDAFFHLINRSATERYQLVITDGDLFVYDLVTGESKTVAFPDGKDYLAGTTGSVMRALTVADYTFIVNSTTEVAMSGTTSDSNLGKALVSIKQGLYSTTYKILLDGVVACEYTTDASNPDYIQTDFIAEELLGTLALNSATTVSTADYYENYSLGAFTVHALYQAGAFTSYVFHPLDTITIIGGTGITPGVYQIDGKISNDVIRLSSSPSTAHIDLVNADIESSTVDFTGAYTFTRSGSSISVVKNNGTAIDVAVQDSYGNTVIKVATSSVQRFSDLPVVAPTGFVTKVLGDSSSSADDYYVEFVPLEENQTFANGNWVETVGPSVETTLDLTTMPHVLVPEADGTFTFRQGEWGPREVGDTDTCPDPSFVGTTIQDIFYFRNRLGVLARENVVFTVAGSPFNFFRETVITLLDSDPIDLAATQGNVSLLKRAHPFQEELLLFTDKAQLILSADGLLTASTAVINQATDYSADLTAKPVGAGDNVYFAFSRGAFSGVREYFIQSTGTNTKGASDVTGHVPNYIDGTITRFAASTSEHVVAVLTDGFTNGFYVYKYYWSNDQKLQSSWSKFTFEEGASVLSVDFIESTLHLVVQREDGYHLESIQFQDGQVDEGSTFVTLLDRRLDEDGASSTYNAVTDVTTWTLPYDVTGTMKVTVRANDEDLPEGFSIPLIAQFSNKVTARGDFTSTKVFLGQTYRMEVTLSEPVLRDQSQGGAVSILNGRLQVKNLWVAYSDTAHFTVEVTPRGRDASTKVFNSLALGVDAPGLVNLLSDRMRLMTPGRAGTVTVKLISESHLPCHFPGAEWELHYTTRSQRA